VYRAAKGEDGMTEHQCDRRGLMGGTIAAFLALGLPAVAKARTLGKTLRDAMTPDQVIAAMLAGNARFMKGDRLPADFVSDMRATAEGQYPAAIVISCIDSRASVEIICDLSFGDAFNARVAGNTVNDDILGSAEYGCAVAGAKAVIVMGHTGCGAIKGAIDDVVLGNLTLLLARFKSAIAATPGENRTSKNHDFVDAVAKTNVIQTVAMVRNRSPVLADLEKQGKIIIVGAMYDVATGRVTLV
jgi:carbonic anhydrase